MQDFIWRLNGCVDRHAPMKKLNAKQTKLKFKPWISPRLEKMIDTKNKLFKRRKRQPSNDNIRYLHNLFRNRVNRELKNYYTSYFQEHRNNIKKTWEGIRKVVNTKPKVNYGISQLNTKGKIMSDTKEIAECTNEYFANVGPLTEKNIPKVNNVSPNIFLKDRNH